MPKGVGEAFAEFLIDWRRRLWQPCLTNPRVNETELARLLVSPFKWEKCGGADPYPIALVPTDRPTIKLFNANPVAVNNFPLQLLVDNPARTEIIIVNVSIVTIYLGLGSSPSITQYDVPLAPCPSANDGTGGSWVSDQWKGNVWAIAAVNGGFISMKES